ncbi:MAG: glycosyltransferase family 39 protein [Pseudomonadota bacterium]
MSISSRSNWYLLLVCLALGSIYAIGLLSRSIWYDEAITLQSLASQTFSGVAPGPLLIAELKSYFEGVATLPKLLEHYRDDDVHPPLYFLVAHGATLAFGNSLSVVRAVSLVLVVLSVLVYARFLLRIGHADPWIYALVYGLSFAAVTTAQDARGYALVLLLGVSTWCLLAALPDWRGRQRIGGELVFGLLCGGLLLTHYFAALLVAGLMAWHMANAVYRRTAVALVAPAVAVAVFLPWAPVFVQHLTARPDQFAGFLGFMEWAKRSANLAGGQVLSATFFAVPSELQRLGRFAVLGLMIVGAISIAWDRTSAPVQARLARIAVVVPAVGLAGFLSASIVLDRWFITLRYFLFFAPFLAYLSARGAVVLGSIAARSGIEPLRLAPAAILLLAQVAMLNFGWEANTNRGGAYFKTVAEQLRDHDAAKTLVIIDSGSGRGTPLAAAYSLPPETSAYLLGEQPDTWERAADEIEAELEGTEEVYLLFTIERGSMESDKALLYDPIVNAVERAGFRRTAAPPASQGQRFYARWTREG